MSSAGKRTLIFGCGGLMLAALVVGGCSDPPTLVPYEDGTGAVPGSGGMPGGGSAGLGGTGGMAAVGPQPTFAGVADILRQNCGAPSCHGGGLDGQALVYTNLSTLYTTLTTTVVKECNNTHLVTPNDPANSALLTLPNWDCVDQSGGPFVMPQGCIDDPCLKADELAAISGWISAGAPGP